MQAQDRPSAHAPLRLVNTRVALPQHGPGRPVVIDVGPRSPARSARPTPPTPGPARHTLDGDDPRWLLARRTLEQLQGGPAAVLPPESRARLNAIGRRLGVRVFDVSLVIAIVQDYARNAPRTATTPDTDDAWTTLHARLRMVPSPVPETEHRVPTRRGRPGVEVVSLACAALALAVAMVALAASWITG